MGDKDSKLCDPLLQTELDDSSIPTVTEIRSLQDVSSQVCQAGAQPLLLKCGGHMQWVVTEKVTWQRTTFAAYSYLASVNQ